MSGLEINRGRVVLTIGVDTAMDQCGFAMANFFDASLKRHTAGDWGDLDPGDAAANDHAVLLGERVLSAYAVPAELAAKSGHATLWIITEADRAATTLLWPGEY